jgi:hypothetical protein
MVFRRKGFGLCFFSRNARFPFQSFHALLLLNDTLPRFDEANLICFHRDARPSVRVSEMRWCRLLSEQMGGSDGRIGTCSDMQTVVE